MATVPVTGFVFMQLEYQMQPDGERNYLSTRSWQPALWSCRVDDNQSRVFVGTQQFTVEVPDDFNPVPAQVRLIEEKKREALALYQSTVAECNERLSKLQAITCEVSA